MNIKANIPNFFTLCNLFCGCIAIVFAFEGNLVWSAYATGICCLFDFLDGLAARALQVNSELGKQLDSLADMVSFGLLPGVIMYFFIRENLLMPESERLFHLQNFHNYCFLSEIYILPLCGFCITVFSAIRLAKFNLDTKQSDSFTGLPTPANTIFIVSFMFLPDGIKNFSCYGIFKDLVVFNPYFYIGLSLISSFLLIAPLTLFAIKFKNFSWRDNKIRYMFLIFSLVLLIIFHLMGISLIILLYIVLSIINNIVMKNNKRETNNTKQYSQYS